MIKKRNIVIVVASAFLLATVSYAQIIQTPFATETTQDIKEALVNIPERVPYGPEVQTLAGEQISLGSTTRDFSINREIYDDILNIQRIMLNLMEMVLNLGIKPETIDAVEINFNTLINMLTNAGIRYNFSSDFTILIRQLRDILADIKNAPRSADFMLIKVRMEVILAEVENALATKLVR